MRHRPCARLPGPSKVSTVHLDGPLASFKISPSGKVAINWWTETGLNQAPCGLCGLNWGLIKGMVRGGEQRPWVPTTAPGLSVLVISLSPWRSRVLSFLAAAPQLEMAHTYSGQHQRGAYRTGSRHKHGPVNGGRNSYGAC